MRHAEVEETGAALAALLADPERALGLPRGEAQRLLLRLSPVVTALTLAASAPQAAELAEDRILSVEEAARRLNVSRDYLYRHHAELPFTIRRGRKLGFSARGLERWLAEEGRRAEVP